MSHTCNRCRQSISENVYKYSIQHFSKALCRKHQPTPQALKLGNYLKELGHRIEFEKDDGYKRIDIAIVDKKVNIEVDGGQHQTPKQALSDLKRTFYSWKKDYVTLRIPNSLTHDNIIGETAEYIDRFLRKDREELEKEIISEYAEENNLFLENVDNFVEGFGNIANVIGNAIENAVNKISSYELDVKIRKKNQ